jgi:putative MFS transporter
MTSQEASSTAKVSLEDHHLNKFHKRLTVYTAAAPFLDGYIISIFGAVVISMSLSLDLNDWEQGLIGAGPLVGMFIGGFLGGWLTDKFGHKTLYLWDLIALAVLSVLQFWVGDVWSLLALRFLLGVAIGVDHPLATSLLAEFLPRRHRGRRLAALVAVWFLGAVVAYIVGILCVHYGGADAWRWALISSVVPGVIFILMRSGTPESPRWLVSNGRKAEADKVIKDIYGSSYSVDDLSEPETTAKVSIVDIFRSGYGQRLIFVGTFWACSIVPQFAITAFAPRFMEVMGLTGNLAEWGPTVINLMFFVGCILATSLIVPMGRRSLLFHSFLWSGLALLLLAIFPNSGGIITLLLFGAYAVFIGGGQVEQYVYPNELFPTEIRATAMGVATSLSRIAAAIGTYLVPILLSGIGAGNTMYVMAGVSAVGLLVTWWLAPETGHLNLHQAASLEYDTKHSLRKVRK